MEEATIIDELVERVVAKRVAESEARARVEGEAMGEARGEARGEAKGLQNAVLRTLQHRFPDMPSDITDLVRSQKDPDELGRLHDLALDVPSLGAFRAAVAPKPNGPASP